MARIRTYIENPTPSLSDKLISTNVTLSGKTENISLGSIKTLILDGIVAGGQLAKVTEESKTGYRLLSENAANHGDIGSNAIDLSISESASTTMGATGDYSLASGFSATASGDYSTAIGAEAVASGISAIALGDLALASGDGAIASGAYSEASGSAALALGYSNTASGAYSVALGFNTSASGSYSFSSGSNTAASGLYSTATGLGTMAANPYQTSIGRFNDPSPVGQGISIYQIGIGNFLVKENAVNVNTLGQIMLDKVVTFNYADDAAAASGGIPVGGLYHTNGTIKIRIV